MAMKRPVEIRQNIALYNLTLLIGPNESGKTALLEKMYFVLSYTQKPEAIQAADFITTSPEETELRNPDEAEILLDEKMNYIIYTNPSAAFTSVSVQKLKPLIRLQSLSAAINEINSVLNDVYNDLKTVRHEEEMDAISSAVRIVDEPVTPSFYTAFAVTLAVYAFALSLDGNKVLLLVDEPEAFAYPSVSYVAGRVFRHLASKSENLFIVATTHSWDFFAGAYRGGAEWVKVYNFRRNGRKIQIEPLKDDLYIPGFSMPSLLR